MADKVLNPDVTDLARGIDTKAIDFSPTFRYDKETSNVTTGINEGVGPRYGAAPVPNHAHQDPSAFTGVETLATTMMAELPLATLTAAGLNSKTLSSRQKVYAILPVSLGLAATPEVKANHYLWVHTTESTADVSTLVFTMNADMTSSVINHRTDFTLGFYGYPAAFSSLNPLYTLVPASSMFTNTTTYVKASARYARFSMLQVKGQDFQAQWMIGQKVGTTPDATHSATPNFNFGSGPVYSGIAPEVNLGTYKTTIRSITTHNLDSTNLVSSYVYASFGGQGVYIAALLDNQTPANMNFMGVATSRQGRTDGTAPVYANVQSVLVNDPLAQINSSYALAIGAIGGMPYASVLQDWNRDQEGRMIQPVDMTSLGYSVGSVATLSMDTSVTPTTPYLESERTGAAGIPKSTAFRRWPSFTRGTPVASELDVVPFGNQQVMMSPPNCGILRADTVYEFTYSIFDKRIGYESNVGVPVRFQTQSATGSAPGKGDFFALDLIIDTLDAGTPQQYRQRIPIATPQLPLSPGFVPGTTIPLNYMQIRFYYREEGSYEWLPALFVDAAQFFYYPNFGVLRACTGAIVGLPGGQPGNPLVDYSLLPKKNYRDVLVYQGRVFWIASDAVHFSPTNNGFAYPQRNTTTARTGEFKGAIVRPYPGQSEQSSRLIVFGTRGTYTGYFTGTRALSNVQVGPNPEDIGQFEIDGSDFVLDDWTSSTAFSSRAAIVADGVLYFWGSDGVFSDNGVQVPARVSGDYEPDLFDLYDHGHTDDIFVIYSAQTREVMWFYPAAGNDGTTTAVLVYDVEDGAMWNGEYPGKVDDALALEISQDGSIFGKRTLLFGRENSTTELQRPVYYDWRNRSGDMSPGREMLAKQITTTGTGLRTVTLATGYTPSVLAGISPGDLLVLDQARAYGDVLTVEDLMARVTAVGAGTIEFELPAGTSLTPQVFVGRHYLPIFIKSVHAFNYTILSKYWTPYGLKFNGFWLALHFAFKIRLLPSDVQETIALGFRTPISLAEKTVTLRLLNNSDGNCQAYKELEPGNQNFEGSSMKIRLSGSHIGNDWVLQYLLAEINPQTFDSLKQFMQED